MKRSIYFFTLLFLVFSSRLKAQKDSLDRLTGIYQVYINPSVEFIIKNNGKQLMLEIPGQGQVNMLADGGGRFHLKEIPVVMQFNIDAREKARGFQWTLN